MDWLPIMPSRGVNLFDASEALGNDECRKAKNLVPVPLGKISKRGGLERPFVNAPSGVPAAAIVSPIPNSLSDIIVYSRAEAGVLSNVTGLAEDGTAPQGIDLPFFNPRPMMLGWNGKVYILPGPHADWYSVASQAPFYLVDTTVQSPANVPVTEVFQGAGNGNVFPAYAFPYKQRLVLANFGSGYENTIVFTDDFTANVVGDDVLSTNGRAISLVAGADGDEIVGGIEVMLTNVGSPAESALLILRKYGNPFLLTGDMDQTGGGTSTLDIKRISVNCGCAGQYTVARTPHGIVWAGIDDVWAFAAGVLPVRLGQKIQPALKLTPTQLQYRWSGAYFDGFYRLAVWGEGQGMALTDAPGDQWWLDLREGLPKDWRDARWWGPQQFLGGATTASQTPRPQTWNLLPEIRAGKPARLFYTDFCEVVGGGNGVAIGVYGRNSRDTTNPTAVFSDYVLTGHEITFALETKEFVLEPPHQQVNDGIMYTCHPSSNIQLNCDFVLDNGQYKYTTTKYMTAEGFLTGSGKLGTAIPFKKVQQVGMYPSNRRAAMQHRFKLYDQAGWSVVTGYNDCLYIVVQDVANATSYQLVVTIPQGLYTLSTLVSTLVIAYNNAKLFGNDWNATFPSGVLWLDGGGPYGTAVSIAIYFTTFAADVGTAPTAAQLAACRRLAAILGFDTKGGWVSDQGLTPVLIGEVAPFQKGISRVELYGLQANFEVIPRTP